MTVIQPWNRQRLGHGTDHSQQAPAAEPGRGGGEMPQQQMAETSRAS
jgi:hypothetical protein